jgi:glutaredoxin
VARAGAVAVTLYERPGCHLCEDAVAALAPVVDRLGATLERVNVEADAALEARFGPAIPVVVVDGVEVARAPIDLDAVREAIRAAVARHTTPAAN